MKILNKIPTIFKITSYQPKQRRGFQLGRGRCQLQNFNSMMKFHSLLCSPFNSRKMSLNFGPEGGISDEGFDIQDFKEENIEEVKELFRLHYYSREPQCRMLNLSYEDHKDTLHDSLKEWVEKDVSAIVRDRQTGTVVGCGLGTIVNQENIYSSISNNARNSNYNLKSKYNLLLDDIPKNYVDLFKKYNIKTLLQMELGTVTPIFGKRGIMSFVRRECERKGKSKGCQMASAIATNVYSQKSLRSNGYTLECEIAFADMRIDGKQVLDLSRCEGTTTSQLLIKRL